MYQNAGEKGVERNDPDDPPRRRANNRRGLGTFANDRPPVLGVVGRDSGRVWMGVISNATQARIEPILTRLLTPGARVHTDESGAYNRLTALGFEHRTVCHSAKEYARDDDGDGFCEVHNNTMEGIWTGLRNFLRPFRGVSKHNLAGYVAVFMWAHNIKQVSSSFVMALTHLHL